MALKFRDLSKVYHSLSQFTCVQNMAILSAGVFLQIKTKSPPGMLHFLTNIRFLVFFFPSNTTIDCPFFPMKFLQPLMRAIKYIMGRTNDCYYSHRFQNPNFCWLNLTAINDRSSTLSASALARCCFASLLLTNDLFGG